VLRAERREPTPDALAVHARNLSDRSQTGLEHQLSQDAYVRLSDSAFGFAYGIGEGFGRAAAVIGPIRT
jgi:hypothetical protein